MKYFQRKLTSESKNSYNIEVSTNKHHIHLNVHHILKYLVTFFNVSDPGT